jgi:glycosyltransferase involved in cell wall biosynthesis
MLLEGFFPPDIRIEKEARTLLKAGHEIFLLCQSREGMPREELVEGIKVFRVQLPEGFLWRKWNFYWFTLFLVDPFWRKHLTRIVEQERIEALHIHDLPMVKTGLSVTREFGIPLIADLHENYPAAIQIWDTNQNWKSRLANRIRRWEQVERFCVRRADKVITVVEEAKEHYVKDCGIPSEKVTVIMNTEDPDYFCSLPVENEIVEKYQPHFTISYIGGFGPHRGVQTAIQAMPGILRDIPNARLLLVGAGSNETDLEELAKVKGVEEAVEFAGQQPFPLVPSYIAASRVCLIPYIASAQTDASCPHKLFQYMAMGKPVIVSSMKSLGRIISETGAGLVYTAGDAEALAEAVVKLYRNNDLADKLGEAGKGAARGKYDWKGQEEALLKIYQDLWKTQESYH